MLISLYFKEKFQIHVQLALPNTDNHWLAQSVTLYFYHPKTESNSIRNFNADSSYSWGRLQIAERRFSYGTTKIKGGSHK